MQTKLLKWGNSPAVRVPAYKVRELGATYGDDLELEIKAVIKMPRAGWAEAAASVTEKSVIPDVLDDDHLDDWTW